MENTFLTENVELVHADETSCVDVADEQRKQFDLLFALKSWNPNPLLHRESTKAIEEKILQSQHINDVINQVHITA